MKRQRILISALALGLLLTLVAGLALAQGPVVQGETRIQGAVGTSFTYQGRVLHNGTPIDGTCDFEFSLWDAPSGGSQVGGQGAGGVVVNDGYFSAELDFGVSAFTGDARYLEIVVDCGGGGALLEPRVALNPAPYAHSLRPGASVESTGMALGLTTSATSGSALNVIASATSGSAAAVYGSSSSPSGAGLSGYNSSSGYGVYGGSSGYGVYGKSGAASGKPSLVGVGVWGDSADGVGVYGTSNTSGGVLGWSTSNIGVTGLSASGDGVQGVSTSGTGVYGTGSMTGTVGIATSTGIGYGVYGRNASSSGAGVYGESSYSSGTGVRGYSASGQGVDGSSTSGNGVGGSSASGNGVWGYSYSGNGVYGQSTSSEKAGGFFRNTYNGLIENAVGVWAGSYGGDIFQGWQLDGAGDPIDREFRVTWNGQVYADGAFTGGGADFAEMLPGANGLEPGDVLVIGPDGQLARSTAAYASAVVGVYSTKPAFVGGSDEAMENPGKVPLAIVGIAPVKASAENGPVAPGDLLVASSTPGYAMKAGSNPPVGTVIGKALEGLESGTGVIQMLVMLQ